MQTELNLNQREAEIINVMEDKLDQASVIIHKAKLVKKIVKARQRILRKGYDCGGLLLDLYNRMGYDFDNFSSIELDDLLQKIGTIPERVK